MLSKIKWFICLIKAVTYKALHFLYKEETILKVQQILTLIGAGYTKEQIDAMDVSSPQVPDPDPSPQAPDPSPQAPTTFTAPPAAPAEGTANVMLELTTKISTIEQSLNRLTNTLHENAARTAVNGATQKTADDVLRSLIESDKPEDE